MFDLLLLIFGLIALFKGEFKITRKRKVKDSRGLGCFMLAGVACSLFLFRDYGWIILLGVLVLTIIIGLASSEVIEE